MGLDYSLKCFDCERTSSSYEYSIVGYIESKHPDECVQQVREWTEFILNHQCHEIGLVDSMGNQSDIRKVKGDYVIGLKDFDETVEIEK